ncbi:MAG: InlB B-repeat-containing protein [Clostridia bacterium]|nr:InlB B-repeat-containing protein [Clostridia bacterium]
MKKLTSAIAILLCLLTLVPVLPVMAAFTGGPSVDAAAIGADTGVETDAVIEDTHIDALSYSYNGYKTYLKGDSTFKWTVPDTTEGGTTCTAMQGMNTGTTYCYCAKRNSSDTYVDVTRINMNTGDKTVMNYYSSTSATSSSANGTMGHANDLCVVGINSVNYMFVATMQTGTAITRLKIDGTKLMLTGYFKLLRVDGSSVSVSAIAHVKNDSTYSYFILKSGNNHFYCKIPLTATGGSKSSPTAITIYRMFIIDTRNAVFAKSNSSAGTYDVDNWTNQGVGYNKEEKVLYVPIWDSVADNRSVIITYNLADIDTYMTATTDSSRRLYPTKTSFVFQDTAVTSFEIESCGFRTGQGTTGDLSLYYNMNCSTSSKEGVFSCSYKSGTGDFTSLDSTTTKWTTKYNANGGSGSMSNTYHLYGISTKLRDNAFTYSGYTFAGWYLTRKSDGKWLYTDADGTARWYKKGSQPAMSILALYADQQSVAKLSASDGDTVTCYAQWIPNATGTTSYYIQYDANGGSGTMAQQKVVYGTATTISKNTFTRDGYVFCGWTAYRRNKAQWCFKTINEASIGDLWLTTADDHSAYIRKTYVDCSPTSKTTSVDRDIVTFYAAWTRVANGVYPASVKEGDDFTLGGTLESTTDMYTATVQVKNSAGTVVASHQASPLGETYDISGANSAINFGALGIGSYTLEVLVGLLNGSTPYSVSIVSHAFEVIQKAVLELTAAANATGIYDLGDKYFTGFSVNTNATGLSSLFEYGVTITAPDGSAVTDSTLIGTGYTISCAGESRTTVLGGDLNCDAAITSADMILMTTAIKGGYAPNELVTKAADGDGSGDISSSDAIMLRLKLK